MTTVDDCLRIQNKDSILSAPTSTTSTTSTTNTISITATTAKAHASIKAVSSTTSTATTVQIALVNNTSSEKLYVSVSGLDISNNNAVWLLESDGSTSYYPENPPSDQYALSADVAIAVGGPGSTRTITVPYLVGARIWYSEDSPLTFLLNRGTSGVALVEPSVTNPSDPNYATKWDFCEFSFSSSDLYANITYVDFVSIPVALELTSSDGIATQTVEGLPTDGLAAVCKALQAQQLVDCAGWDRLVVQVASGGTTDYLRALSPNSAIVMDTSLFDGYYQPYVDAVWSKYSTSTLTVDTQSSTWGTVTAQVDSSTDALTFSGIGSFAQPSTADIFNCSSGPFVTTADEMGNLTARLAAAFNRTTLLSDSDQPDGATASDYYQTSVTNHYARILHAINLDGRGYAFPYDDVAPTDGADQSGAVSSSSPELLTVYVGGGGTGSSTTSKRSGTRYESRVATVKVREMARQGRQMVGGRRQRHYRRSLSSLPLVQMEDEKKAMAPSDNSDEKSAATDLASIDLEKGGLPYYHAAASAGGSITGGKDQTEIPSAVARSRARFSILLHQMLLCIWGLLCAGLQSVWAIMPRSVAVPVGKACATVAAVPAVKAAASGVASAAGSAFMRPLLVRTAVAGVLLLVYMAAGVPPIVTSVAAALSGQGEPGLLSSDITSTQPAKRS